MTRARFSESERDPDGGSRKGADAAIYTIVIPTNSQVMERACNGADGL